VSIRRTTGVNASLEADPLSEVLSLLRARTGHDFRDYKPHAIAQRVERRVRVHQLSGIAAYVKLLTAEPHELDLLLQSLLIAVTQFFRDPPAYAALSNLLAEYLTQGPVDASFRLWVPGCSTGEEAYSLVIVLLEQADRLGKRLELQAFATDLDEQAVAKARTGRFDLAIARDVGPERLERFFTRKGDGYRVEARVRECVAFAAHNVLRDPPFAHLDLLSCRNLLVYLSSAAQSRMFRVFHQALRPQGILWLGASESAAQHAGLFAARDDRWQVYCRREALVGTPAIAELVTSAHEDELDARKRRQRRGPAVSARKRSFLESAGADELLRHASPAVMVVDRHGEVVDVDPNAGPQATLRGRNLFGLLERKLSEKLAVALHRATVDAAEIVHRGIRVDAGQTILPITLFVQRIEDPESLRGLFRVRFSVETIDMSDSTQMERSDMSSQREHTLAELATTNQELQATNEELQATNEELRAASEGLETLRREARTLAITLNTRTAELQQQLEELARVNSDLQGLLDATDVAVLLLDSGLRIKRFNAPARKLFGLRVSDVGRPLADLTLQPAYVTLLRDAGRVLTSSNNYEAEAQCADGRRQRVTLAPYHTTGSEPPGVLVTCADTTPLKTILSDHETSV
jgi:two-component system CheB/CheR fusion protein